MREVGWAAMPPQRPSNLRERNKARVRGEIADVALQLCADRGFENVTVDEIVQAAQVSRRTFFRYFESKEEALLADYPDLHVRLAENLATSAHDEPLGAARRSLHQLVDWYIDRTEAVLARSDVIRRDLGVAGRNLGFLSQWEASIASTFADHLGANPGDLVPRTAAVAIVGAFRSALREWIRSSATEDLHALTDRAFDVVSRGIAAELHVPEDSERK
jgi:AcrR family transcriptional regulator